MTRYLLLVGLVATLGSVIRLWQKLMRGERKQSLPSPCSPAWINENAYVRDGRDHR